MNKQVELIKAELERRCKNYDEAMRNPSYASYEASLIAKGKQRQREDTLSFINFLPKFEIGQTIRDPEDHTFTIHINKIEDRRYIEKDDVWVLVKEADENYEIVEDLVSKPFADIEIPFGAKYSELIEESITIPEGCYAVIEGNRVVIRKGEEPVSEDLDNAAFDFAESCKYEGGDKLLCVEHFKAGANWQNGKDKKEWLEKALDFFGSNYNSLIDGGVIGAFDDKEKMIEEFVEFMKDETKNQSH